MAAEGYPIEKHPDEDDPICYEHIVQFLILTSDPAVP